MLTADLVRASRRKGQLKLSAWRGDARDKAVRLATGYTAVAADFVGSTRAELLEAIADLPVGARERKVADGLKKLVLDRCTFETDGTVDAPALREWIFEKAANARREGAFDRDALFLRAAEHFKVNADSVEDLLFGDLKEAQRLLAFDGIDGPDLVDIYDEAQVQAVLLRAESIVAEVRGASAKTYRALFRKLKFLRLLHEINAVDDGYRIELSGPLSLFRSGTKYGLSLALALPAIRACNSWELKAKVRWGKERTPLDFAASGKGSGADEGADLPDDVCRYVEKQRARVKSGKSQWMPRAATKILDVPGLGTCIPDLVCSRGDDKVYVEVMGFWSRDAVWKRVELAEAGLPVPMVFVVPSRLRVSETVLPDELPAALCVYKGVISPAKLDECLDAVAGR
ncbi:MAG: DUF790 family protein [Myxococcota bacterium]